jgi:hypothetical protein
MSNVPDIMARAEADLRDAEASAVAAQARADAAQADADSAAKRATEMRAVLGWLRAQSESRPPAEASGSGQEQQSGLRFGRPIPDTSNTDLCLQVLESFGRAATTKEIRNRLAQEGHDLSQEQVRGALKYLAGKKTDSPVETTPGSGLWRLRGMRRPGVLPAANGAGGRP